MNVSINRGAMHHTHKLDCWTAGIYQESDSYKLCRSSIYFNVSGRVPVRLGFPVSSLQHNVHPQASIGVNDHGRERGYRRMDVDPKPQTLKNHRSQPAQMNEFVKTHILVKVLMFPISGGRKPAMNALSRVLFGTI